MTPFDLKPGAVLFTRYRLEEELDRDDYSAFWRARDEKLRHTVVIHFLPGFIKEDEKAMVDFRRAGWKVSELRHPNIGKCYELLEDAEFTAVVTEELEGNTLAEVRKAAPGECFEVSEVRELLRQTLNGLQHAHLRQGVPHGSLTPSNIRIHEDGHVRVFGFQTGAILFDSLVRKGFDEWDASAVPYFSPQRWNGESPSYSDDVYGLGVIIYELLTGKLPFIGEEIIHHADDVPPMEEARRVRKSGMEPVPEEWEVAIAACLHNRPEDRPHSIAELGFRLQLGLEDIVVPVEEAAGEEVEAHGFEDIGEEELEEWELEEEEGPISGTGSLWKQIILAVSFVAVVSALVYYFAGGRGRSEPSGRVEVPMDTYGRLGAEGGAREPTNAVTPSPSPSVPEPEEEGAASAALPILDTDFAVFRGSILVREVLRQPDGRWIVAGMQRTLGERLGGLTRLLPEGTPDESFALPQNWRAIEGDVHAAVMQANGGILVGGDFKKVAGLTRRSLVRFRPDGKPDPQFFTSIEGVVYCLTRQLDGRILVGGRFSAVNGQRRQNLARLLPDGSPDASFDPAEGPDGPVNEVLELADTRLLIAGEFDSYAGVERHSVARLMSGGALDLTFAVGSGSDGPIHELVELRSGKILAVGAFQNFNQIEQAGIVRLMPNGHVDPGFSAREGANGPIYTVLPWAEERLILAGDFTQYQDHDQNRLVVTYPDGSWDDSVNLGSGFDGAVRALVPDEAAGLVVGGEFRHFNGVQRSGLLRLDLGASEAADALTMRAQYYGLPAERDVLVADSDFDAGAELSAPVQAMVYEPDDRDLVAAGAFSALKRFRLDGSVDRSFDVNLTVASATGSGESPEVMALVRQPGGNLVLGGRFQFVNGEPAAYLARIDRAGHLDPDFLQDGGPNGAVRAIVPELDGSLIIGGEFDHWGEHSRRGIARLLPGGALDSAFDPRIGVNRPVHAVLLQPDGQIVIGGDFLRYNGFHRRYLARVGPGGGIDAGFKPGLEVDFPVRALALQRDGKILVGGGFDQPGPQKNLLRLLANGTVDPDFNPGGGADARVMSIELQRDGRIVAGGDFGQFDRFVRKGLVRLQPDGRVDPGFDPGEAVAGGVRSILILREEYFYLGGNFNTGQGAAGNYLVRMQTQQRRP